MSGNSPERGAAPRVSAVIPVFNRAVAVRRAIASVLAQTCQDFEIIVVDDASTDGTAEVVRSLDDPRITLLCHDRNRGGSAARNTGFRAARAPFVAFLDSDDEWLPTKLERQLEVFARSSERLALVYSGKERVYADGSIDQHIPEPEANLAVRLLTKNVVGETTLGMVRRSALEAIDGFDESLPASQDMDLWLRLCERFDAVVVPEVLVRISKGDDRGRITASSSGMTRGRELYWRKHADAMRRHGVLHAYLRDTGWVYQRIARSPAQARRSYLASLKENPFAPLTYALYALAFVPLGLQDASAKAKHRWTGLVRRIADGMKRGDANAPAVAAPGKRAL